MMDRLSGRYLVNTLCYSAYGLVLTSTLPLPELLPGEGKADVCIEVVQTASLASSARPFISYIDASPGRAHLIWGGVGDLLIEEGRRITVIPGPDTDEDALRLFVLGAGLGVLLHQRGLLVLHASGVAIHHRVVGFIGAKGWGKSTMAATLHQCGYPLISDELLVIRFNAQNQPLIIPGFPQIKLWSDALVSGGGDPDSAIRVRAGVDKFSVKVENLVQEELPLHRLYLLGGGEALSTQPVSPSEGFFGLVPHLYVTRFGTGFLQATGLAPPFQQLNLLLQAITIKRLLRRRDLNQLPEIAQMVTSDILQE